MSGPRMMFYHDGRHPLIYMYEPPMQKEEYEAAVDELLGTPVDALMYCLGDGRTVLHDTEVGELWGHNVRKWPHIIFQRAHRNAKTSIRRGEDPLRIVCDRAHEKGLAFYPTLLVQQGRGPKEEDVRCSDFRFENAHLEIGAKGSLDPEHPVYTCLDFLHEEVREERFAIVRETLRKYPVDGFELQLNYSPYYFHPKEVKQGLDVMTEWVGRVYREVKRSGSKRELVIRIPVNPRGCMKVGLDVHAWIEKGIVDVLVGQTFSGPELVNQMADFRPLVEAAKGSGCRVHAALQSHVDSDRLSEANIEMVRAVACNAWAQDIDGVYLAHWFGNWPYKDDFYAKLREIPHPEIMATKDKYYYVPTQTGRYPDPSTEPSLKMELPRTLEEGIATKIPFQISDDLRKWNHKGRVHEVLLRCRVMSVTERDKFEFRLNGRELREAHLRKLNEMYRMTAPRYRTGSGYWFIFKLPSELWPRSGRNNFQVTLVKRDRSVIPEIFLRDVELEIKYLMGKNAARGQDADLGEYERANI